MKLRSVLFAGASRADLVAKLDRAGADAAVLDLEDAVPAAGKEAARAALPGLVAGVRETPVLVRLNGAKTAWFEADLAAVAALPGIAGVVLAKAERPDEVAAVVAALGEAVLVLAGIETARGVADVESLLAAGAGACYFGAEDYIADLGGRRTAGGAEALYARSRVALAARLAEVPAIDQAVVEFRDDERFRRDADFGRDLGYRGKLCIHPAQVPLSNQAFSPSPQELRRAQGLLAAWEEGIRVGVAAVEFEGEMVDGPAVRMARDLVDRGSD